MSDENLTLRPLIINVMSGIAVQAGNLIIPLLLLPYLARVFGVQTFGEYIFGLAVGAYAAVVVEWGYSLGATRDAARMRFDVAQRSDLFANVLSGKIIMAIVVVMTLLTISCFVSPNIRALMILSVATAFATALSCDWLMIGVEKGAYLALGTFAGRLGQFLLVILFVRSPDDVWIALLANSAAILMTSIITIIFAVKLGGIEYRRLSFKAGFQSILANKHFFLLRSTVQMYAAGGPLILGAFSGTAAAAIYGGADRIARASMGIIGQISVNVVPRVNALAAHMPEKSSQFLRFASFIQLLIATSAASLIFFFSKDIVYFLLGPEFFEAINILRILVLIIILSTIGNILGVQVLVAHGHAKLLSKITLGGLVLFIPLCALASWTWNETGAAVAILITEIAMVVAEATAIRKLCPDEWHALTKCAWFYKNSIKN